MNHLSTPGGRLLTQPARSAWAPALFVFLSLGLSAASFGQAISTPPSGGNQKASVMQHIGLVEVRIDYSSPDVTGPNGQDRRGQIWGQLVPYGLTNLGFGNGNPGPWRAGANENTVLTVSHDVEIEGKQLPAGSYGLHMIVEEDTWTLILSENSTAWGSFFYDEADDALRAELKPREAEFREWLTYDFVDRQADRATVELRWEEIAVPFEISVPDVNELYFAQISRELESSPGFNWQNWMAASQFCVQNNFHLEKALEWAEVAISTPFVGQENFSTLQNKSQVLSALGKTADAKSVMTQALNHTTATPTQIHGYARQLQIQGRMDEAVEVFKLNNERFGKETWPIAVGMARALSAEGKYKQALEYAKLARQQAPDALNQGNLDTVIEILGEGRDFNATN